MTGWGMLGIWIAMAADWVIRSFLYVIRFLRGKWIHLLDRDAPLPADDPAIK
jgi:Na+-driven multidrug efflux pump